MSNNDKKQTAQPNMLQRLFNVFNWEVACECCGTRMDEQNFQEEQPNNGGQPQIQNHGRSTATSERQKHLKLGVHKLDEGYLKKLLEEFSALQRKNTAPIKKKKDKQSATPKWNNQLEEMLKQAVGMYGTNLDLIHAFFPGFGKQFLERKLKKIDRIAKQNPWTPEDDQKLVSVLYFNDSSFQVAAGQFTGRTLQSLVERFDHLKQSGFVAKFLQEVNNKGQKNQPQPGIPSIGNLDMVEEEAPAAPYLYNSNNGVEDGINNNCFDFNFEDPIGGNSPQKRAKNMQDIFDIGNLDSQNKLDSYSQLFNNKKSFGSLGDIYDHQITQIFGQDGQPKNKNNNNTSGFLGDDNNENDNLMEAERNGSFNDFFDMKSEDGSNKNGDEMIDNSPNMKLNTRKLEPTGFGDMMM